MAKVKMPKKRAYSVLMLYPESRADSYGESFYSHVKARTPWGAIEEARIEASEINGDRDLGDEMIPALVIEGNHKGCEI